MIIAWTIFAAVLAIAPAATCPRTNPKAPGPDRIALEMPAATRIAARTHTDDRVATVISGTFFGDGTTAATGSTPWVRGAIPRLPVPGRSQLPATSRFGPTDVHYLDSGADPRPQADQHSEGPMR